MGNRICTSCGAQVPSSTKFCTECGAKLEEQQPSFVAAAPPQQSHAAQPAPIPVAPPQTQYQQPDPTQPPYQPAPISVTPPPPQYQQPASAQPQQQATHAQSQPDPATATGKPMSVINYLLTMLLFAIPILGPVMGFVWALGKETRQERKNFAQAYVILFCIGFIASVVWGIVNYSALMMLFKVLMP